MGAAGASLAVELLPWVRPQWRRRQAQISSGPRAWESLDQAKLHRIPIGAPYRFLERSLQTENGAGYWQTDSDACVSAKP
jgi:hypothetical protein